MIKNELSSYVNLLEKSNLIFIFNYLMFLVSFYSNINKQTLNTCKIHMKIFVFYSD